jgi:3-isopropylmalate/(R)-2-methylmalate dehydratase small subunit
MSKAIDKINSTAVPLDQENVDTDQIIPARFLKATSRDGFGENLFRDWRYNSDGSQKKDFVLNDSTYSGRFLVAGANFGCGSSREHAAWALSDFGFRAVIAPSFADIFFSNAGKNGIVLIRLSEEQFALLLERAASIPDYQLTVSLEDQTVTDAQGFHATFEIDPFRKFCLTEGLDDIGLTLRYKDALDAYESRHDAEFWVKPRTAATP